MMLRLSQRFMRRLGFDALEGEVEHVVWDRGVLLSSAAIQARRKLVLAASKAAQAALAARPVAERLEPLAFTPQPMAEAAFRAVAGPELRIEILFAAFLPTVLVYPEGGAGEETSVQWWRDDVPPHEFGKGVVQLGPLAGSMRIRGEAFLMPPALRSEGRRRTEWMRSVDLDPPRARDGTGPFWSLGESEIWRLDFLGWHEQLILAGLIGTRIPVTAVVCEPRSVPRIGYVVEMARELGRTLVHVPLAAVPEDLRAALEESRDVSSGPGRGFVVGEAVDPDEDTVPAPRRSAR